MSQTLQPNEIHEAVKSRYRKIATSFEAGVDANCCGPADADCSCASDLYDVAMLADLPADISGLSLGCGDPVTLASLEPGQTVLDLGSGAGLDVFLAARQVGHEGRIIGVDMTGEMLARAETNKAQLGEVARNTEFRKGLIEALPLEDSTADVVISNCVINLSPDKPKVFREAHRILKPGGRLAVSDIVIEGAFTPEQRANMDDWSACVSGALPADDYLQAIRTAGFVDVNIADKHLTPEEILSLPERGPRIYSARVTATKPKS